MGFILGLIKYLGILLIPILIGGGYIYYLTLTKTIATLKYENAQYQFAEQVYEQVIKNQKAAIDKIRVINNDITEAQEAAYDAERSLVDKFNNGNGRDFGKLAIAKPGLIENIINTGTAELLNNFEEMTDFEGTK